MEFLIVAIAVIIIFIYNSIIDTKSILGQVNPFLRKFMEKDYEFLLRVKYKDKDLDVNALFSRRIRDGVLITMVVIFMLAITGYLTYMYALLAFVAGFVVFKSGYTKLKNYYKARLHYMDSMLPYYLKSLEILVQHYTVPVALSRSIDTAPEIFRPGLRTLVAKIDEGDSTIQPYIDFANEYPVRDSMRMMRLLYRLGLGSQEDKHEQIMMFSRTVSSLQNKAREQKYKDRLESMEKRTMMMLFVTGGGVILVLFLSMTIMMGI
ncbi:MAG: prepilin peptidase [Bacilli bacterium]|nr:prepilin peptidase [Bacilli bacterium]